MLAGPAPRLLGTDRGPTRALPTGPFPRPSARARHRQAPGTLRWSRLGSRSRPHHETRGARRAYRSSLFPSSRSGPSPAARGGGTGRGASAEAGSAAISSGASPRAGRGSGAGRAACRKLWFGAGTRRPPAHQAPASAPRGLQVPSGCARPADYKSHQDARAPQTRSPTRPRGASAGKGPNPRFTTNSAAQNPWKKINKHLFDTVIFNTYS